MVFPHPQDHILPDIVINSRDNSSNDDKSSNNNKNNKTRITDIENKFMVTKGKREDRKEKLRVWG